jgi:hypothetical protein
VTDAATASATASSGSRSECGNVKRTAVCATAGVTPIATSTCEGSSLPAAHAEPLDETTPRRSSSRRTASPLVPANVKLAVPGRRWTGSPVTAADGTVARTRAMKRSRIAETRADASALSPSASSSAVAKPTAPATSSVPLRRPRS